MSANRASGNVVANRWAEGVAESAAGKLGSLNTTAADILVGMPMGVEFCARSAVCVSRKNEAAAAKTVYLRMSVA